MPGSSADRNLLFGILALQMDFIDRDQLVQAMHAWALEKSKALGQLLEEQGALSAARRALLEPLVDEHISQHGNNPKQSLASISSVEFVQKALAGVDDPDVQATLTYLHSDPSEPDQATTQPASAPTRSDPNATITGPEVVGQSPARFRILRPHAKGGIGTVYVALDNELNRQVALKEIQDRHADQIKSRARFLLEAEITGGLEHPGIVPVYSLGHNPDGRPFYAMRFIEGDSLKQAIGRFHATRTQRDPGARNLELQKLLRRFLDVCEAVAYAHSRGVLHRDLKPGNIMVGKYGETLVVDWGLAKVVGTPEGSNETTLRPSSASGTAETLPGSAIGTPGYMSPEQAAGKLHQLGPASDVYSLGATLYALLTARPPVDGSDVPAILARVQRGEILPPRRINPEVPQALEAICLKALALNPADRYKSSMDLAADLEAQLADEPVSAWQEPLPIRARRWVRRHQRLVSGAAASLIVGFVALAALAAVITLSNRRLDAANTQIQDQNTQITAQNEQLEQINAHLDLARDEADQERDQAESVTGFLVESFQSPDPARDGRTITIAEVLDRAAEDLRTRDDLAPVTRAKILNAIGQSYDGLGLVNEAVDAYDAARDLNIQELGADHIDTLSSQNNLAIALKNAGRLDQAIPLYEQTLERRQATLGDDHKDTLTSQNNLGIFYKIAGRLNEAISLLESTLKARRVKIGEDHPNTLITQNNLANAYKDASRFDEAIALHEQTLEAMKAKNGDDHPNTLSSSNNLANAYQVVGRLDEAIALLEQTLEIKRDKFGDDHQDTLITQSNLADAYRKASRFDEAIALLEQTLEALRAKFSVDHPDALSSQHTLAITYQDADRLDEAITLLEQTLEARRANFSDDHPETLASILSLGHVYKAAGQIDNAISMFEENLKAQLAKHGHDHSETQNAQRDLVSVYMQAGRFDEAISLQQQIVQQILAKNGEAHSKTLIAQHNLAYIYRLSGRLDEAISLLETVVATQRQEHGDDHSDTLAFQHSLAVAYRVAGRLDEAIPTFEAVLEAHLEALGADHADFLNTLNSLAYAYKVAGRLDEAIPMFEQAMNGYQTGFGEDHSMSRLTQKNLIEALEAADRFADSEAILRNQLDKETHREPRDDPAHAGILAALGANLIAQRKSGEAEPTLRDSLMIQERIAPDDWNTANTRSMLGEVLLELGNLDEAEPLLLEGRRGIVEQVAEIPEVVRELRLRESADRLVRLYVAWDKPEAAEKWRRERGVDPAEDLDNDKPLPKLPDDLFAVPGPSTGPESRDGS